MGTVLGYTMYACPTTFDQNMKLTFFIGRVAYSNSFVLCSTEHQVHLLSLLCNRKLQTELIIKALYLCCYCWRAEEHNLLRGSRSNFVLTKATNDKFQVDPAHEFSQYGDKSRGA